MNFSLILHEISPLNLFCLGLAASARPPPPPYLACLPQSLTRVWILVAHTKLIEDEVICSFSILLSNRSLLEDIIKSNVLGESLVIFKLHVWVGYYHTSH